MCCRASKVANWNTANLQNASNDQPEHPWNSIYKRIPLQQRSKLYLLTLKSVSQRTFKTIRWDITVTYWARWAWPSWIAAPPLWPDTHRWSHQRAPIWWSPGWTGRCPISECDTWARLGERHVTGAMKKQTKMSVHLQQNNQLCR